ncbi:MAG: LamG domain-containing protein [Candidatus Acidiferrales bacterium]
MIQSQRGLNLSSILILLASASVLAVGCHQKSATNPEPNSAPSSAPSSAASTPPSSPAAPSGFVATTASTNPLAYYRLESKTGPSEVGATTYQSLGGVTNAAGAPIGLPGNQCAVLNGTDAWISTSQIGGISTAGSIMAWVNLAVLPAVIGHIDYVAGESQSGNDFDLQFEADNSINFYTSGGAHSTYVPDKTTLLDQWHMIVATMDSAAGTRAIYWDGLPVITEQVPSTPNKTSQFTIGSSPTWTGRFFNGSIDEVAVWNVALSASQVAAIYGATKK